MKLYRLYENASIKMVHDQNLHSALNNLKKEVEFDYILETGTYRGDGSTELLAQVFHDTPSLKKLYSCEVDQYSWEIAQSYLTKYPKVVCLHGLSVAKKDAIEFVNTDLAISQHEDYPDIYIDDISDPKEFYLNELSGQLSKSNEQKEILQEGLICSILKKVEGNILICLDSAGGIGYLEFLTALQCLESKNNYWFLLDDIHHLKHFRSRLYMQNDRRFDIYAESTENGWLLAKVSL